MINLENVSFAYSRHFSLFDKLNLTLSPGNIYGLLGKNGTGKTTLIKLMTGLLIPKSGTCNVFNSNVSNRYPSTMSELFIIPEEFLLPSIKMNDYVRINSPFYPRFSQADFNSYLHDFEIKGNSKLQTPSFGQKKKFLLSFGLATNVKLLLLDEPTNGLDIPSKSQFRKTVARSLNEEKSIVISTHQARDLESLIDSIIILENGKIIFNSSSSMVTQRLSFGKTAHLDDANLPLYKEDSIGGYKIVSRANGQDESELDLELFFNAIVSETRLITSCFEN
jgi:ABC-2 type transport system ATP-binding protein